MKRILLFVLTNLAVILVAGITLRLLGVDSVLDEQGAGLNLNNLLIFAAVFGFGGSFVSLLLSKWTAKKMMGVHVIEQPRNQTEQWLFDIVRRQAKEAGIGMPEVGIYDSPEINAFATGASRNKALVAVSSGLLRNMTPDEAEAVLGHEVAHVANGDMITLALIQGVVNTFVIFLARVIGHTVDRVVFKNENGHGIAYFVTSFIAEMILGILASAIVMWFSRQREFRADAGGARLAGRQKMIAALERLQAGANQPSMMPDQMAAFGINSGLATGLKKMFTSHPPLSERIAALRAAG
ncbi:MAG: protease HtpX [Gammaproteobacteria bacterium]|nr:protease HtpX [Gammaproteobacteria bacterium]